MLAVRWLLLVAVTGCGARTSLESPFSTEEGAGSEVEACTGWTIDGPPFVIPSLVPPETSDIAPTLVPFQDGSLSLLLFRSRPPDAPRELVRWRLQPAGAWPPPRADEVIANGFCDARLTEVVDGSFGALVKDHWDLGCQNGTALRWFSPIEATSHPPLPAYDEGSVWGIIAAAQSTDHALLVIRVYQGRELVRIVDTNGTVLGTHDVPCAFVTKSAVWFDGHFYLMARHDTCVGNGGEGLSVFRLNPSTGTLELVAQWPTSGTGVDQTAIVTSSDGLWYAWNTYDQPTVQLIRANADGEQLSEPIALPWTEKAGSFALTALRDRLVLARYEYRNNQTSSVAVDWIDRGGALLEQVTFPAEPGGAGIDVAVDDHTAIVAWDGYATEISTFRVWLGRASCR